MMTFASERVFLLWPSTTLFSKTSIEMIFLVWTEEAGFLYPANYTLQSLSVFDWMLSLLIFVNVFVYLCLIECFHYCLCNCISQAEVGMQVFQVCASVSLASVCKCASVSLTGWVPVALWLIDSVSDSLPHFGICIYICFCFCICCSKTNTIQSHFKFCNGCCFGSLSPSHCNFNWYLLLKHLGQSFSNWE